MFRRLLELFGKKLQKMPHMRKKPEESSIWRKLATFSRKLPSLVVWVNFSAKNSKRCLISKKKHEQSSIWPKLPTFSRKLPCFVVRVNFSAKSCKKSLISRKSLENRRFGEKSILFRGNYHVSSFG